MSLKAFHIIFILVSTALAIGFGIWTIREYFRKDDPFTLVIGVGSLVSAVVLVVYGGWFLRKLRGVSYL